MSEEKTFPATKKLLEKSPLSGIAVPVAIVLVSGLIIFGVTKMLSSGKDHRDLVSELNSKTFGNRWVAAYELSKYLAASRIPKEDIPWVIENLVNVYEQSVDPRTRNFVVLALGSLQHPLSLSLISKALDDEDAQVRFSAVVTIGNLPPGIPVPWDKIKLLLSSSSDMGLKQALIATIATHRAMEGDILLRPYLVSESAALRYSAAMGLIYYNPLESVPVLKEILSLPYQPTTSEGFNGAQIEALKVNVLLHIQKAKARQLLFLAEDLVQKESNIQVSTRAKELVNLLKN